MNDLVAQVRSDLGLTPRSFDDEEIRDRYMAAMVNEAAKILDEGIAAKPSDIDAVLLHGYGFPRHKGGPMHWADTVGLDRIVANILSYAADDPYFWALSPLLEKLASEGRSFADLNAKSS